MRNLLTKGGIKMSILELQAVGDLVIGPNGDQYFEKVKPIFDKSDLLIGQLEVPYTLRDEDNARLGRDPEILQSLINAGFDIVNLAGNHIADAGNEGIEDTINWLKNNDLPYVGAGMNLEEARRAVILERNNTKIGFLDYNCMGPDVSWATLDSPGCAYVGVHVEYETVYASPGAPPIIHTRLEHNTKMAMVEDIKMLRPMCDVLVVNFHKGIAHTPVKIADYEKEVCYAAIDAGADVIFSHHAHILKGIEVYKGKTIYHGLCNMVTYVPVEAFATKKMPASWAKKRKEYFGFEPDPNYPTYPFHPEAIYTMIAKCDIKDGEIISTGFYPCIVNKKGIPEVVGNDERGQLVFDYVKKITEEAELNARFSWDGESIKIFTK